MPKYPLRIGMPGKLVTVDDVLGARLIQAGLAESDQEEPRAAVVPKSRTAMLPSAKRNTQKRTKQPKK